METLGALIDKMSIINLKLWHCQEALLGENAAEIDATTRTTLESKNTSLLGQRSAMIQEMNTWIARAVNDPTQVQILNPQNKMYGRFRKDA